jgi:hypothetical protein
MNLLLTLLDPRKILASFTLYLGGGGSSTPAATSQTVSTSNIAPWAQPGVSNLIQAGLQNAFPSYNSSTGTLGAQSGYTPFNPNNTNDQMTQQAYQAGQATTAGFSPLQQQSFNTAANMQMPGQYNQATGLNNAAAMGNLGSTGQANMYGQMGAMAGNSYGMNAQNPGAVASYMNPYLQSTLTPSLNLLNQQYGMQQASNQGAATQAGAFGGSRGQLQNQLNQQNQLLATNQLTSNAYNQAYNTANTNMQQAATLGMQGAAQGLAGVNAQQAGYNNAGTAGNNLANIGTQQLAAQQGIAGLQNAYGSQQQQQQQNVLNAGAQNYATMQAYPIQQLQQLEGLYTGAPTNTTTQNYQAAPSTLSQVAGLGMAGYGLSQLGSSKAAGGKKGGTTEAISARGGIDKLPAKNLERFAKGGIAMDTEDDGAVHFADNMQQPVTSGTDYNIPGLVLSGPFNAQGNNDPTGANAPSPASQGLRWLANQTASKIAQLRQSGTQNQPAQPAAAPPTAPPAPAQPAASAASATPTQPAASAAPVNSVPNPTGQGAAPATTEATGIQSLPVPQAPRVGGGPAPTPAAAEASANSFMHYSELAKNIQDFQRDSDARTDAYLKQREEGKPTTPAMLEYEARLKAQEAKAANEEHDAKGLAFLTAGLSVLGGASPYAGVNLGQATKGVEQYRDAMKDIKRSADERDKAFAMIEQARHADARGDWEEKNRALSDAFNSKSKAQEFGITALTNLGVKSGETAANLYSSLNKDYTARQVADAQNQTTLTHAGITANAPLNTMQMLGNAKPGSPLMKGFELQKQEAMIPHLYQAYMTTIADPMKGPEFRAQYPTFEAYMAGFSQSGGGGNTGFVQPPANAKILQPK